MVMHLPRRLAVPAAGQEVCLLHQVDTLPRGHLVLVVYLVAVLVDYLVVLPAAQDLLTPGRPLADSLVDHRTDQCIQDLLAIPLPPHLVLAHL